MSWLLLWLALLSLLIVTEQKPIYAFLGEEIRLECSHGVVWYEDGFGPIAIYYVRERRAEIRKYEDLIQVDRVNGTLSLTVHKMNEVLDTKKFICCKQSAACPNPITAVVSYRLQIASVSDPIVEFLDGADAALEPVERVIQIYPKETLTVSCLLPASSFPLGDVTIHLMNSQSGQELEQRSPGNIRLTFRPTTSSLNGTVIFCESQNDVGRKKNVPPRKSHSYTILVYHVDPPAISVNGSDITQAGPTQWVVKEDTSIQLTCEANCYPQCIYEWQCDDSTNESRTGSQLVISSFNKNVANCTCRASISSSRGVWLESSSVELEATNQPIVIQNIGKIMSNMAASSSAAASATAAAAAGHYVCLSVFLLVLYDSLTAFRSLF